MAGRPPSRRRHSPATSTDTNPDREYPALQPARGPLPRCRGRWHRAHRLIICEPQYSPGVPEHLKARLPARRLVRSLATPVRKQSSTLARAELGGPPTPRAGDPVRRHLSQRSSALAMSSETAASRSPKTFKCSKCTRRRHRHQNRPCRDPKPFKYDQGTGRRQVGWLDGELCADCQCCATVRMYRRELETWPMCGTRGDLRAGGEAG